MENEALSQQVAQLQEALEDAESASDDEAALVQLEALCYLNQVRALYNDGRYSDARDEGYWVRWPMVSPTSSDRTTTPWRPTSLSWSGWADCFT